MMRFRAFIEEDSAAVIAQIRDIRDQMRVIKLERDLEREKDELQTLKQQKRGEGVDFPGFTRHFLAWKNSLLQIWPEKHLQCDYVV